MASSLSFDSQYNVLPLSCGDLFDVISFCGVFVEIRWIVSLWSDLSMDINWIFSVFFYVWLSYLCKSLWIISFVWSTRLIFLAMGRGTFWRVRSYSARSQWHKGKRHVCIVAIKDKMMEYIPTWIDLVYIMSSCLRRYSVLMNLIL